MYIALRRVVRLPQSEKIGLFDLDERDEAGAPVNFGLLHLHYLPAEVRGTMILAPAYWQRLTERAHQSPLILQPLTPRQGGAADQIEQEMRSELELTDFVDLIMQEACAPPGVAAACRVLVVFAAPGQRQFLTNSPRLQAAEEVHAPARPDEPVRPRGLL